MNSHKLVRHRPIAFAFLEVCKKIVDNLFVPNEIDYRDCLSYIPLRVHIGLYVFYFMCDFCFCLLFIRIG